MTKQLISIVTPTYNEQDNINELYRRVKDQLVKLESRYDYEIIVIDNCSEDKTQSLLRELAKNDKNFKVILNNRNYGHIRSPYYGILQSSGDATIYLASDLQDPPEKICEFVKEWENGYKLVMATKPVSEGPWLMHGLRRAYYRTLGKISDINLVADSTGFGLYDSVVIEHLKSINDPYPFLRGLICELGYPIKTIDFLQPRRLKGVSKNSFITLYDIAMLGFVSQSVLPLRFASFIGFIIGFLSLVSALIIILFKIIYWEAFPLGIAPILIGMFFMFGLVLCFIGLLGEYISLILGYVRRRPIVIEHERINF